MPDVFLPCLNKDEEKEETLLSTPPPPSPGHIAGMVPLLLATKFSKF